MTNIIVAFDDDRAIGCRNGIPWHLSTDLRRFKEITTGHTVVMGSNTWRSLPSKPLKNRRNIVISASMPDTEGCEVARSIDEALALSGHDDEIFIIGGDSIYRQTLDRADRLIVTHVYASHPEADTFFPAIDSNIWHAVESSERMHDDVSGLDYRYITYER
ncbi:MAG: dihydrofolate reductase [Candidatus Aphodosoma sp.]